MLKDESSFRFYLHALSNLIAAFGGGIILGRGMDIVHTPYLKGGSILAFFVGTILGLAFMQFMPEKIAKPAARYFSVCGGITSVVLFAIFVSYSADQKLFGVPAYVFFALLSIRFCFWFYSRVIRASNAAGRQQRIAWVEFGYYFGMILGLVFWKLSGLGIELALALLIDACLQIIAGVLDIGVGDQGNQPRQSRDVKTSGSAPVAISTFNRKWYWKLTGAIVFLTIGVQVVIFNLAHHLSDDMGSYVLAAFYLGVSIAALVYKEYCLYLSWDNISSFARIRTNKSNSDIKLDYSLMVFLSAVTVAPVLYGVYSLSGGGVLFRYAHHVGIMSVYFFIFIAAMIYEILALAILDRIGHEQMNSPQKGMIMRTYGLMGVGAAISLWILGIVKDSYIASFIALIICMATAAVLVAKRNDYETADR